MTRILLLSAAILSVGCGTVTHYAKRPDFSQISIGMSQQQVLAIMGKPEDIAAEKGTVYLNFSYAPWYDHSGADGHKELYFVRLLNDKVDSFGHKGDFDTTKNPTVDININEKADVRVDKNVVTRDSTKSDLFTELQKLKVLKEDGLLTEEEFEDLRKKAIRKYQ
jgi:hypothetical protein